MKKKYLRFLVVAALAAMNIGCSKEDATLAPGTKMASINEEVPYELSFPNYGAPSEAGVDPPNNLIFPMPPDDPYNWPYYPYTVIQQPTAEYLKETCLFDVSKLENNKTYTRLKNGKLTIGFYSGQNDNYTRLLKLKSGSESGWNSDWGAAPFIERENPDVFYSNVGRGELIIYFSKPCIEFGFEFAPNHKNYNHNLTAAYGDWIFDNAKGNVSQLTARSPSGARLIAVKSTKPFTMITIRNGDSPTGDLDARGFAIANLRYRLAD